MKKHPPPFLLFCYQIFNLSKLIIFLNNLIETKVRHGELENRWYTTWMKKYLKYKGVTVNRFGIPVFGSDKKDNTRFRIPGKKYYQYKYFIFNFKNTAPKNLIVMYDIPSDKKKERDWFRRHLKKFDYIMIQKSVWVGPSPLPKEFLKYVKLIGLLSRIKTLKLAKPYSREDRDM